MSEKPPRSARVMIYSMILPKVILAARECGYAIGLHGSMASDLDLIAVPWTEDATDDTTLASKITAAVLGHIPEGGAKYIDGKWEPARSPGEKPHGRRVWTISFGGDVYIDLSVMPIAALAATGKDSTGKDEHGK